MRKLVILFVLLAVDLRLPAASPPLTRLITVQQLEELIAKGEKNDGALLDRLSEVRLRERLTDERLAALERQMPGRRSRQELIALADESSFLELPSDEIPTEPMPDVARQRAIFAALVEYTKEKLNKWPSFYVSRATTRYEGTANAVSSGLHAQLFPVRWYWPYFKLRSPAAQNWECPGQPTYDSHRMSVMDASSFVSIYRGGHEVRVLGEAGGEFACPRNSVDTADQFGEVPLLISLILVRGRLSWDHWEKGPDGLTGVLRYRFTLLNEVNRQPRIDPRGIEVQGELAVDARSGTVQRVTAQRRWAEGGFMREYSTMVELAPVDVGGSQWVLPVRRVALFRVPFLKPPTANKAMAALYRKFGLNETPVQEYLNDVSYMQYRPYVVEQRTAAVKRGGAQQP